MKCNGAAPLWISVSAQLQHASVLPPLQRGHSSATTLHGTTAVSPMENKKNRKTHQAVDPGRCVLDLVFEIVVPARDENDHGWKARFALVAANDLAGEIPIQAVHVPAR